MNILVLCDHGQTRSVAMASVLREAGHFAVAGSYDSLERYEKSKGSVRKFGYSALSERQVPRSFADFFEVVLFMQEGGEHFIGRDVWSSCDHPELLEKCREKARELELL